MKSEKERGFLKHLLNKRGDLSFLSYFPKQKLVRKIQGKFKKLFDNFVSEQLPLTPKNLHFFQALSLPIYFNSLQFSKSLVPARHACHTILIVLTLRNFSGLSCPKETSAQTVLSARFMEHLITSKFYEVTAILPSWRGRRCQI